MGRRKILVQMVAGIPTVWSALNVFVQELQFVSVIPKYMNSAAMSRNLLAMLWYCPAFSWQDKHMLSNLRIYLQTITRCDITHTHSRTLYCSPTVNRRFPVAQLTLQSMYDLMWKKLNSIPFHKYHYVLTTDLNSAFHKPKKSMCDLCEAYKNKE
jgi:hypothetical protein